MPINQCIAQPSSENLLAIDGNSEGEQLDSMQEWKDFGELRARLHVFIKCLPSMFRDLCRREFMKIVRTKCGG